MTADAALDMDPASTKRWQQIEALFVATLDLPADERRAFLDTACEDASLRAEVIRLLAAHDTVEGFLEDLNAEQAAALIEAVDAPFEADRQVGPYRVIRELGRGGMGIVYLAQDTRLDRAVALKFLPPHLSADEHAKQRLMAEAKAASALDHPNIAVVHKIGETEEGRLFIAMAYYKGETLREKIARGPLPLDDVLALTRQIAEGLQAAHAKNIVHRDVKPGNVLVSEQDVAKLVDFGIAKAHDTGLTKEGTTLGTVAYMSPEQTQGETVDARSDLWSLGVVLYEMLTGERPFKGTHEQTLIYAIRHDVPTPVERLRPEIPAALADIVERCLTKDPDDRYPDAGTLLADLDALRTGAAPGPRRESWMQRSLVLALVLVAIGLAGLLYVRQENGEAAPETAAETILPQQNRLAVLPLDDLSPDPDDAYFADGLTDELIGRLSRLNNLRVIARTSVLPYRGTNKGIDEIGQELNVGTVLEGRVRKVGDRARITLQLIDAESEESLWTEQYDAEMDDVLAVQSEVARQVAEALQVQMQAGEQQRLLGRGTDHADAFRFYLKGRYAWNKRTVDDMQQAKTYFEQAIDLDPAYANAWAGLADVYATLGGYDVLSVDEAFPRARAAAQRALSINPTLAEAHTSLATVLSDYYWRWNDAEQHFRQAIDLNPNHAVALYWFSEFLANLGRFDEALVMAQRAQEVDPFSLIAHADEGRVYYLSRRYDKAIEHFKQTLERGPQFVAYLYLGLAYAEQGHYEQAITTLEEGQTHYSFPDMKALLGNVYARAGRRAEAQRILDELLARRQEQNIDGVVIAVVYLGLGNIDAALDWLEKGYEERNWQMIFLGTEPTFDPLRSEPRFQALLENVGLPQS